MTLNKGDLIHQRYRLVRLIGRGTSGAVWAARNELIDRNVALKILDPEVARDEVLLQRFFNEAKAIGRVSHPSIVGILDLGQAEDGSPFLVLELLEGEPLSVRIMREGRLHPEVVFDVCSGVVQALALAHQQGIVHRDLKPANIYLHRSTTGELLGKILDFGISKIFDTGPINFSLTTTGTVVGSPAYMSPEQAAGREDIDGRADVWSMGVVLYEALTGNLPFEAPNYNALMVKILTSEVVPLHSQDGSLPEHACRVVESCMHRDRDERPTAEELYSKMQRATRELRRARYRDGKGRRSRAPERRQPAGLARGQLWRSIAIGAISGLTTALITLVLSYYLMH